MITPEDFRKEWFFKSRLVIAQVRSVDVEKGTVNVSCIDDLPLAENHVEIPVHAISIQGFSSSWIRYMPQQWDLVYLAFGPKNEPRIVGFATRPEDYQTFQEFKDTHPDEFPNADFTVLQPGEWDLRSSGGAYIYGDRDGHLLLSGGPQVQMRFDKPAKEVRTEGGLWVFGSEGSAFRIGDVKRRVLATDQTETTFDGKEASLHIETPPSAPGLATLLIDEKWGDVKDETGVAVTSSQGQLLRHQRKIWGSDSTSSVKTAVVTEETDASGNKKTELPQATNIDLEASLAALSASLKEITLTASTTSTVEGASVKLGSNAAESVLKGDTMVSALTSLADGMSSTLQALAAIQTIPSSSTAGNTSALATQFAAMGAAWSGFSAQLSSFKSTKVKTE